MKDWTLTLLLAVTPLVACGGGSDEGTDVPTTRELLARERVFAVDGDDSAATLHAEVRRGSKVEAADVTLAVTGGAIELGADAELLVIDDLSITFGDVALPVDVFPAQLVLTGIHAQLARTLHASAYWSLDDQRATAFATASLRLDWKLAVAGEVYPLGAQTLDGLDLAFGVDRDETGLLVELGVTAGGVMWSWADVVALGDLDLTLTGRVAVE